MFHTRIEIVPAPGIVHKVMEAIPVGSALAVSTPPSLGIAKTLKTTFELASLGYKVVPHLPAHEMQSRAQLARIVRGCQSNGITEVLAIRGDSKLPEGPYRSTLNLMEDIVEASAGRVKVAIAGYPESRPVVSALHLFDSLLEKSHLASHIVTQMCFSSQKIVTYADILHQEGLDLPVWAGVAGAVPRTRLISLATKIGVGPSLVYLRRSGPLSRRLLSDGSYSPAGLISDLQAARRAIAGVQLHSFNIIDQSLFYAKQTSPAAKLA